MTNLLTVKEFAEYVGFSTRWVYRQIKEGRIRTYRAGERGNHRIDVSAWNAQTSRRDAYSVEEWFAEHRRRYGSPANHSRVV